MRWLKIFGALLSLKIVLLASLMFYLAQKPIPETITYGMSFNTPYARELGLDWQVTYDAILDDLQVRQLRLAAHWPMVEPEPGKYNFSELDYQLSRAAEVEASVILAVGRRLPRWPECHIPGWVRPLSQAEQQAAQLRYMQAVVERYRHLPNIIYWQVENEPFLKAFAFEHCGELDVNFLDQEIAWVRTWDPSRPILVTDSGNLGLWTQAYQRGDAFGTSVYVHFWNPDLGQFRTLLPPFIYRVKAGLMSLLHGNKNTLLIELSAEPWLLEPIAEVPIAVQFTRMNQDKFVDILDYARATRFDQQYLWGAEWWYWLLLRGHPEIWETGRSLFVKEDLR